MSSMTEIDDRTAVTYTARHGVECTKEYDPDMTLRNVESEWIAKALIHHNGNLAAASEALGISRAKLYRRLRELDMEAQ